MQCRLKQMGMCAALHRLSFESCRELCGLWRGKIRCVKTATNHESSRRTISVGWCDLVDHLRIFPQLGHYRRCSTHKTERLATRQGALLLSGLYDNAN